MPSRLRKAVLTAHVTTSVGWLGAVVAYLALDVAAVSGQDVQLVRAAYLAAMRTPEAIHAVCADYRSGAFVDGVHDEEDRTNGRQLTMPVTVISQEVGTRARPFDLTAIWTAWAPHLRTVVLDGGHLIPEEHQARSRTPSES